jgi:choline dehydrogenase-like flavoprotein
MNETEILIIGSGPAGINAAWPLVLAGRSVLMIDANSSPLPLSPESNIGEMRESSFRWRHYLGADLGGLLANGDYSPKLSTPLGRAVILAGESALPKVNMNNFMTMRSATPGGLSAIWGAFCSAYDATDMKSYLVSEKELAPYYIKVAERIGISGANDHLADFHGVMPCQDASPLTPSVAHLFKQYMLTTPQEGFLMGLARNAVITKKNNERDACNQCGLCLLGCARKSIYNSAHELDELKKYNNFRYLSGVPAKRLISLTQGSQVVELAAGDFIKSKHLFLAAGTINSTALVLEYAGIYDTQLRVLSNPVAAMAFVVPKLIGSNFLSNSFGLGQLSYRLSLPRDSEYAMGVIYGADTLPLDIFARHMPFTRPVALRLSASISPALLLTTAYLPGKYSMNSFSLERRSDSAEIKITGCLTEEAKVLLKVVGEKMGKTLRKYGAYFVPGSLTISPPGSDAHVVGTVPMGGDGVLSCSLFCELNIAPDVYMVDGSWLPELPAKHCTFTIMANAYRVGSFLANKLESKT